MKKTILVALFATTLFACSTPAEKAASTETDATASSCVKEGPDVDLMKKAITAYASGDWAAAASCFSDTATSSHNNDTVAMKMSARLKVETLKIMVLIFEALNSKYRSPTTYNLGTHEL